MQKRRLLFLLVIILFSVVLFSGRLLWLQTPLSPSHSKYLTNATKQRKQSIVLDSGRGHFYDRHMHPLTGNIQDVLVVFPIVGNEETIAANEQIARILEVPIEQWMKFRTQLSEPTVWQEPGAYEPYILNEAQKLSLHRISENAAVQPAPYQMRYSKQTPATHLLGFIGQNEKLFYSQYAQISLREHESPHEPLGVHGLEKTFDRKIKGVEGLHLVRYVTAGRNDIYKGIGTRLQGPVNPFYPLKVKTTLDLSIQLQIEQLLEQEQVTDGAVVVLDVPHADVIAMASRPQLNRQTGQETWSNQAILAIAPGSIFKTVVAAAALEKGVVHAHERFYCNGAFGKYGFHCWNRAGHGKITFSDGYAQSCNIVFAQVMQRLTGPELEQMAAKLGLLEPVGWQIEQSDHTFRQFHAENRGVIFQSDLHKYDEGALIQTAIGQRDVAITPLQAANLVVTILNEGTVRRPRIVSALHYADGSVKERYAPQLLTKRAFSKRTAHELKRWMSAVVTTGTAKMLQDHTWKLAGKTGTAQVTNIGESGHVQWFIGYGPVENPRYAVAIMLRERGSGKHEATRLFGEIMELIRLGEM